MRWRSTLGVAALAACCLVGTAAPAAAFTQLDGPSGCVAQPDAVKREGGCAHGRGLLGASGVAVSPDGRNVYVASALSDAVSAYGRDPATGALTQLGCVSHNGTNGFDGTGGECVDGKALDGAAAVVVSPDGAHVYVASAISNAIAEFSRDPSTGELTQVGCIEEFGEQACYDGRALLGANALAITPNGRNVYVASPGSDAVAVLSRNAGSGRLNSQGCVSDDATDGACSDGVALVGAADVAVAPDGGSVFAAAPGSGALLSLVRDDGSGLLRPSGCLLPAAPRGPCTSADDLSLPGAVAVAPDGANAYVAGESGRLSVVSIESGDLSARGCLEDPDAFFDEDDEDFDEEEFDAAGEPPTRCTPARGLLGARDLAVTPAGTKVLVAGAALSVFDRNRRSGALAPENCVSDRGGSCDNGVGLRGLSGVVVSPDGRNAYAAARDSSAITAYGEGTTPARGSARLDGSRVVLRLRCPAIRSGGCKGRVALERRHGRAAAAVGSRGFRVAAGRSAAVPVPVSRRVRRSLAEHRRSRLTVVVSEPGALLRPVRHVVTVQGRPR